MDIKTLLESTQIAREMGSSGLLLACLLLGHVLADFYFQSSAMVKKKKEKMLWLGLHGLEVFVVQLLFLVPFFSIRVVLGAAIIGVTHTFIDGLKVVSEKKWEKPVLFFSLDQLLHIAILIGVLVFLFGDVNEKEILFQFLRDHLDQAVVAVMLLVVYLGNAIAGAVMVGVVLRKFSIIGKNSQNQDVEDGEFPKRGRIIGILERTMLITLVLVNQWTAIAFVITAKSVARFKELEESKDFSEYYLIGTLTSLLIAVAFGLLAGVLL